MRSTDLDLIAGHLADPSVAWSLGSFGAIAEFIWSEDEPCIGGSLTRTTSRGAIRIAPVHETELVAYETPSRHAGRRRRELALCLPFRAGAMAGRGTVTEIGPDAAALRVEDRGHLLFDIGLAQYQVDVLVRTDDPETIAALRAAEGRSLLDPDLGLARELPRLSPHRVFESRCGRIEVYQPIPAIDGRSPDGPHTHVLPKLLRTGRTHAANVPIPNGCVPCLTIHLSRPDPDHATLVLQEGA